MKYYSKKFTVICFLFFYFFNTQIIISSEIDLKVSGKIVNKETKVPVEYANVFIENYPFGVISNINGDFVFNIPAKYQNNKIIFSCIGFESDTVIIANSNFDTPLLIELIPKQILLEEVTVKPINPLNIIREAIKKIPDNYPDKSTYLYAYYREMVKVDTAFVKYSDAACKIYYCGYNILYNKEQASKNFFMTDYKSFLQGSSPFPQAKHTIPHQNDAVKIIAARKSNNLENFENEWGFEESLKKFDIGGGPLHITAADIVKLKGDFLDTTSWKYYQFKYKGMLEYNNRHVHKISFSPINNKEIAMWEGYMYIDKSSLAFTTFEFFVNEKFTKYLKDKNIEHIIEFKKRKTKKKIGKQSIKRITEHVSQSVRVNYTFHQNKWYLTHIKIENVYNNKGDLFEDINYETYLELFVNDIDTQNVIPLHKDSTFHTNKYSFMFQYPVTYNSEFWKSFNIPLPSGLFEKAMKDIEKEKKIEEQFQEQSTNN